MPFLSYFQPKFPAANGDTSDEHLRLQTHRAIAIPIGALTTLITVFFSETFIAAGNSVFTLL